jgi:serine/threonine protein kinase/tetratricopeptide (TPR) repeat protein
MEYSSWSMEHQISHYRLEEKLGEGGMGVVYRAVDDRLQRTVALKFLSPTLASDAQIRQRFMQEARAASSLDHPNLCTIFEIDETVDGEMFIVMAYYAGETLDKRILRGPLEIGEAIGYAIQIARGLAVAHDEMIIHRDIKPGNLLVSDRKTVKILDFGLAKLARHTRITQANSSLGTPAYMSPEQIRSEGIDHRTDIWSLGVVLFETITGRLPFRGDRTESVIYSILNTEPPTLGSLRPNVPPALEQVVRRALAKSVRVRYEKMEELIADLQMAQGGSDGAQLTIRRKPEKRRNSVAVLPFHDVSPQKDQEYFCDGIADELLSALSEIEELHVASRTSAFQFKGTAVDVREIGEKLNVSTVLEGSVRKAGDRVRITAQLVNVEDGYRLWTEKYDRDMKDIFAIQDEIAQNIARALKVTLGDSGEEPEKPATRDVEAYDYYLKARQFFHQHRRKGYEVAKQMYQRAIEIDAGYARAWAGIANCASHLRLWFGHGEEAIDEAMRASAKAIEIDPDSAEARVSRGLALTLTKQYDEAEMELKRAEELNSSLFDVQYVYAYICFGKGDLEDAARHFEAACEITPEAYFSWRLLASVYQGLGKEEKARQATIRTIEATKKHLERLPDDTRAWTMGAFALAETGEPDKAREWVERALAIDHDEPIILYNAACVYLLLGDVDKSLDTLEATEGNVMRSWMENDPDLDPIRDHPRFQAILDGLR